MDECIKKVLSVYFVRDYDEEIYFCQGYVNDYGEWWENLW